MERCEAGIGLGMAMDEPFVGRTCSFLAMEPAMSMRAVEYVAFQERHPGVRRECWQRHQARNAGAQSRHQDEGSSRVVSRVGGSSARAGNGSRSRKRAKQRGKSAAQEQHQAGLRRTTAHSRAFATETPLRDELEDWSGATEAETGYEQRAQDGGDVEQPRAPTPGPNMTN